MERRPRCCGFYVKRLLVQIIHAKSKAATDFHSKGGSIQNVIWELNWQLRTSQECCQVTFYKHGNYRESAHVPLETNLELACRWCCCAALALAGGIAFMTSSHAWLADVFYLAGGILFIVKFLTWEDARQLDSLKRRNSYGLAIGLTLIVLCAAIWGDHRLNAPDQDVPRVAQSPSIQHSPERKPEDTSNTGAIGGQNPQSPELPSRGMETSQEITSPGIAT